MPRTKKTPGFLSLPPEFANPATARYAVLPIPYEGTVSYKAGTAAGPAAIIDASTHVELLDEELLTEPYRAGIVTLKPVPTASTPEEQIKRVKRAAENAMAKGQFVLALGGEHSVTVGLFAAAMECHGPISVLQIDAHADLRDEYCGHWLSHGAVMCRVLDLTDSICQVGIRSFSSEELTECPEQVKRFITPEVIRRDRKWIDRCLAMLGPKVYITVDIDGLDPAFAPGTGTPEPGGLDWQQVTQLLRTVCAKRQVVSADIVEVRPIGMNHITEYLAARLAYKIIAYTQQERA